MKESQVTEYLKKEIGCMTFDFENAMRSCQALFEQRKALAQRKFHSNLSEQDSKTVDEMIECTENQIKQMLLL